MTLLILGGTQEARTLSAHLAKDGIRAVVSLAGETQSPIAYDLPTRIGGFGGDAGFADYVQTHKISAVLDATHPFAHVMSHRAYRTAQGMDLPYAQMLRPAWQAGEDDQWIHAADTAHARDALPQGATVFLATGKKSATDFIELSSCTVYLRVIDPPQSAFPWASGAFVVGRPPFEEEAEVSTFQNLGVTHLVVKNAGGVGRAKLDAARRLGIQVVMIDRPLQPDGVTLDSVAAARAWIKAHV